MLPQLPAKCESHQPLPRPPEPVVAPEPRRILSLRSADRILYAELIQAADISLGSEPLLWVRPLMLAPLPHAQQVSGNIVELKGTADLVWPAVQFTEAYAEEVLPLWPQAEVRSNARHILNTFMKQVWQFNQADSSQANSSN